MSNHHHEVPELDLPPTECYTDIAAGEQYRTEKTGRESNSYLKAVEIGAKEAAKSMRNSANIAPPNSPLETEFPLEHVSQVLDREIIQDWLVEDLLTSQSLAQIFGEPGTAKSFLAIDLACSVATGTPWHNHKTKATPVIYLAGEGHSGLAKRFKAFILQRKIDLNVAPLFVSTLPASMTSSDFTNKVCASIEKACGGGTPGLIILDTMARNLGEGDENSLKDMSLLIRNLDYLKHRLDCCVLLIHHTGHNERRRARGASNVLGALDHAYRISKAQDTFRLESVKQKDNEPPPDKYFTLASIQVDDGRMADKIETSATLELVEKDQGTTAPPSKEPTPKNQKMAFGELKRLVQERRNQESEIVPDYDRISMSQWKNACENAGMQRNRFSEASKGLIQNRHVLVDNNYVSLARQE